MRRKIKQGKNIGVAEKPQGKIVNVIPHPKHKGMWRYEFDGEIWCASDYAFEDKMSE